MLLGPTEQGANNAAVLGHETVHVYIDQLSEFRLTEVFSSVRFFHEGLASYVEYRFFKSPEQLAEFRAWAAVAHSREALRFDDLVDDAVFTRKRDANLVYPLGEIFVAALVKLYGDAAPGQVVRAFGRTNAPKDLTGIVLWQDTLQACGELDRLVALNQPLIASLPRLRASVEDARPGLLLRPAFTGKAPGRMICVVRPSADAPEFQYSYLAPEKDGTFRLDRSRLPAAGFSYQLGWRLGEGQPHYEPWTR